MSMPAACGWTTASWFWVGLLVLDGMRRLLGGRRRGPVKRFGKLLNGVQRQTGHQSTSLQPAARLRNGHDGSNFCDGHSSATSPLYRGAVSSSTSAPVRVTTQDDSKARASRSSSCYTGCHRSLRKQDRPSSDRVAGA